MNWLSETFVVDPRPNYRYQVEANRYTPKNRWTAGRARRDEFHVSLVFLHSIGMFKETFEPVIDALIQDFPTIQTHAGKSLIIDEAWAIECPNSGHSATLNAEEIRKEDHSSWSFLEYAHAARAYLQGTPGGHDLAMRNLVLIGQSNGAEIIPFLAHLEPELNLYSIILGDPVMSPRCPERELVGKMFADMCLARRDVWSSRDAAREYFERNPFTKGWPLDAKELYLRHALIDQPTSRCVTLACRREHQASIGRTVAHDGKGYDLLAALYASDILVHYLYDNDAHPLLGKFRPVMLSCKGFKPTTARPVRGGHMFFQMDPVHSAELIATALEYDQTPISAAARL